MGTQALGEPEHPLQAHPLREASPVLGETPSIASASFVHEQISREHLRQRRKARPKSLSDVSSILAPPPPQSLSNRAAFQDDKKRSDWRTDLTPYSVPVTERLYVTAEERANNVDPLRAALISRQRELTQEHSGCNEYSQTPSGSHCLQKKTAYATPLSQIFNTRPPRHDPPEGIEEGCEGAPFMDASDLSVLESQQDHERSTGIYIIRTRKLASSPSDPRDRSDSAQDSDGSHCMVRRSIADFHWLESTLRDKYEAVIVPSLPPMALAGRLQYGYAYDYERRRGLEKFIRRVATHAILATVDEVLAFLGILDENAWNAIRRDTSHHQSVIASAIFGKSNTEEQDSNPLQWFSRWGSYKLWQAGRRLNKGVASLLERDNPMHSQRKEDTMDDSLQRLKTYVHELGSALERLRRACSKAVTARMDHVRSDDALGLAFVNFGEKEGGQFGRLLQCIGAAQSVLPSTEAVERSSRTLTPSILSQKSSSPAHGISPANEAGTPKHTKTVPSVLSPTNRAVPANSRASTIEILEVDCAATKDTERTLQSAQLDGYAADESSKSAPNRQQLRADFHPRSSSSDLQSQESNCDMACIQHVEAVGKHEKHQQVRRHSSENLRLNGYAWLETPSAEHAAEALDWRNDEDTAERLASSALPADKGADYNLEEVLRDYEQRADGAKRIMGARLDEREAYEHAIQVYTRLRDKLETRTGSMWKNNAGESDVELVGGKGVEELYSAVTAASSALTGARKQYQDIALATTEELRRLRSEMHADIASALYAVARENAQHHAARAAVWSALARQCEAYTLSSQRRRR